ncbi:MAG: hypothetical protein C0513_07480 [Isosphaera sp.]|nr:hypothetical protein [Isosphaera sp.]
MAELTPSRTSVPLGATDAGAAPGRSPEPSPDPDGLAAVLAAAARGDEAAWRELVGRYARRVFALVRSRIRRADLAEEVTQSVLVTVASKIRSGSYVERGAFESWLFRIAMNRTRDEARRLSRQAEPTDPEHFERDAAPPAESAEGRESRQTQAAALRGAMARLSDADRAIIELRHHAGLSFAQIAAALDEPLGTLLARHHRALRKLKDMLAGTITPETDP